MSEAKLSWGLQGKVSIITGAANGIGQACARLFAQQGAKVVLADIQDAQGQALAQELVAQGHQASFVHCDVGIKADVDALVEQVMQQHGRIDVLVSNAGIFKASPFLEVSESDFDEVLRVNLKGAFLMGRAAARAMKTTGGGAIVHMSSVNGVMAIPEIASYNVSKGGINQLTRAMALALADDGIRVNAVAPGTIATELARQAVLTSDAARRKILSRTPMKRLGEPEEVARAVAFLASDASSYITGEILTIDGGRTALNYTVQV
jgi:NAD(P)-dependent dehydrogenase (short-subunit alcohol dehydrogenase family)